MTEFQLKQMEKERQKALGDLLIEECKNPRASIDSVRTLLENGAQIGYKYCEALRRAVKTRNFGLIRFLIENGALEHEISFSYISRLCDQKWDDKTESEFFDVLDLVHPACKNYMSLYTPYINNMAVAGRLDKLKALQQRYFLTEAEIASVIELRVIFEIVLLEYEDILQFINRQKNWMDRESFDLAVDSGEWIVLEYLLRHVGFMTPSDKAVGKAVYDGNLEVLTLLIGCGYDFMRKPLFLEKACRAAMTKGTRSLEFLLGCGYTLNDSYLGKTIAEHAEQDRNTVLLTYLQKNIKPAS